MLPKENRLKKSKDIENVWKKGKGWQKSCLLVKVLKNDLMTTRFAFVVSTKVSKKAVVRNQIKRRLREMVRKKLAQTKTGFDVIINALPGIEAKSFQELEKVVEGLLNKALLILTQSSNVKSKT